MEAGPSKQRSSQPSAQPSGQPTQQHSDHHRARVLTFVCATLSVFFCLLYISPNADVRNLSVFGASATKLAAEARSSKKSSETSVPSSTSCSCPAVVTMPDCGTIEKPFLGGVDVVEYWSLEDGETGVSGSSSHSTTRNGYSFYFKNKHNLKLFEENPDKYTPKFGGFCSWAVSGEFCSDGYPWAADCLGPSGNWGVWTIKRGKLFFFLKDTAKDLFLEDVDGHIAAGEARWAGWYPDEAVYTVYNSNCYFTSSDSIFGGTSSNMARNGTSGGAEGLALLQASSSEEETS